MDAGADCEVLEVEAMDREEEMRRAAKEGSTTNDDVEATRLLLAQRDMNACLATAIADVPATRAGIVLAG